MFAEAQSPADWLFFEKRRQICNCLNFPDKTMNHWNLSEIIKCCSGMLLAGIKWSSWSQPLKYFADVESL